MSDHYWWSDTIFLANVIFYLNDTARTWFETHKTELTLWDLCKTKLIEVFRRTVGRQHLATKSLSTRVKSETESYMAYIWVVLSLCKEVDSNMSNRTKVDHILQGIADDAF